MMVRVIAGAFIIEGNDYLLMKRSDTKKIAPGMWGGVGGHAEPNELNSPKKTCLREIYEETGIEEADFKDFNLKYIIIRRNKGEIVLMYYFIALSKIRRYEDKTQEGKLHWINKHELLDRPMSFEIRSMLKHYISIGYKSNEINVGTVSVIENKPVMNWNTIDSWEGLTGIE
ncbi:NUDIX domain-containing protein [Clostridium bornimense]|uniref:NUDIX domain-containing protein n=2 Tax=Clostridium TaxID=1485 RepID=UPI001C0FA194|nr:NUDIX domain-containing protein [Clostridium bornimense]MBU5315046.1 NUDIX domain-containing protein [Clostridium bornimense]